MLTPRTRVLVSCSALAAISGIVWQMPRSASRPIIVSDGIPSQSSCCAETAPSSDVQTRAAKAARILEARQDLRWKDFAGEPASEAFRAWTEQFRAAAGSEKSAMIAEGIALADTRRAEFAALMRQEPERALAVAVPQTVRRELPPEVLEKLERPLDTLGEIEHLAAIPGPGADASFEANQHFVTINGQRFRSYVTAERASQPSMEKAVISGYLLDQKVVLRPTAGRLLEPGEVAEVSAQQGVALCPVSKSDTKIENDEAGLRIGDQTQLFCSRAHASSKLSEITEDSLQADGPAGPAQIGEFFSGMWAGNNNASTARATGTKTLVVVRVDFADYATQPISEAHAKTALNTLSDAWSGWSNGLITLDKVNSKVTTQVFRLPKTAAEYNGNAGAVRTDALAAANAASPSYNTGNYSYQMVAMPPGTPGFGWAGLASVTGSASWVASNSAAGFANVAVHELGHNLGLNHAGSYSVSNPNPVADGGAYSEYGDDYDAMGSATTTHAYNARYKLYLGWLSEQQMPIVTRSGVYRIAAHDDVDATGIRGLRLVRSGGFDYDVEYRSEVSGTAAAFNDNGVQIRLGASNVMSNANTALLDMTSQSANGKNDAALAVGRTYADPANGLYITTLAKSVGATFDSMDVLVNLTKDAPSGFWTDADIGAVGAIGLGTEVNGVYSLNGAGTIAASNADALHFLSQNITGDCDLKARVTVQSNTSTDAKAGVMIRDGSAADAKYIMVGISPANTFRLIYRSQAGSSGVEANTAAMNSGQNNWVRLKRVGNVFSAYTSANGTQWTQLGSSVMISMAAGTRAGVAVGSQTAELSAAQFDNVSVQADSIAGSAGKTLVNDTFDTVTQSIGDDAGAPDDVSWVPSNANLSLGADATLNSGNALHVDVTTAEAAVAASIPSQSIANTGDSLEFAFDFCYAGVPGNWPEGFRFGVFNNSGSGYYAEQGIGGNTAYRLYRDDGNDYSFANGTSVTQLNSATKTSIADTAKHTAKITLTKVASGVAVSGFLDGIQISSTDSSAPITAFTRILIRNGGTATDFHVDNVRVTKIANAVAATVVDDTFDVSAVTFNDEASDPSDIIWTPTSATLTVVNDSTMGSGNVVNVDATAAYARLNGAIANQALSQVGDAVDLSFDFRYTSAPANVGAGFRFGFFNAAGDGFYISNGTGGNNGSGIVEDIGSDSSFGSGSTLSTLTTGTASSLNDTAKHTARIKIAKVAAGLKISGWVDGASIATTDAAPASSTFDTILIRNGNHTADFRVDNIQVKSSSNSAPVWTWGSVTLGAATEDAAFLGSLSGKASDANAEDILTYSKVSGPSWLNVGADGTLSGTPTNANVGTNTFTVKVTDDFGGYATATLNIAVSNVNDAPTFSANPIAGANANEDAAYSGSIAAFGADVDAGDSIAFSKVSGPSWLSVAANGALSGTPGNSNVGANAFTVKVTDAAGASATATLSITVINVNDAPAFSANPIAGAYATEDSAYNGSIAAFGSDVDAGDSLTFSKVSGPSWLSVATNGALSGTPGNSNVGTNAFTVKVTDAAGASATATLNITVINVNDAPTFNSDPITKSQARVGAAYSDSIAANASDVDAGDTRTYSKVTGPAWLNVAADGALTGVPPGGSSGSNTFTVRVSDVAGESATATLNIPVVAILPGVWGGTDIGSPDIAGESSESGGVYTISGSGSDVWGTADSFQFAATTLTGDGEIRARVTSQSNTDGWAKAGVMIRETTAASSTHGFMFISPDYGFTFQYRASTGGDSTSVPGSAQNATPNNWVRLSRCGSTITAYASADGSTWTQVGTATISMASSVSVGLAVTSHNDGALSTATFDNVTVTPFPAPWISTEIGSGQLPGKSECFNGAFTIAGSGAFGNPDRCRYVYQPISGDGSIVARIRSVGSTGTAAKIGIMIRETLADNSRMASLSVSSSGTSKWDQRTATGGSIAAVSGGGSGSIPNVWLKLERVMSPDNTTCTITASRSPDKVNWTQIGTGTITMSSNCYVGLCVASGSASTLNTAVLEDVTVVP